MNNLLYFLAGVAVGGAAGYFLTRDHFRNIADEEIQEVKEVYKKKYAPEVNLSEKANSPFSEAEQRAYKDTLVKASYIQDDGIEELEDEEEGPIEPSEVPYVISPDEFVKESSGIGKETLRYYVHSDTLVNEQDEVIDIESNIGEDFLNHFGEFETNTVFVRNEAQGCDYEVLREDASWPITEELG